MGFNSAVVPSVLALASLARFPAFLPGFKGDPAFLEERFGKHFDVDALRDNVTRLVFY